MGALGFTKKRVLPEPEPPMTRIFLFLAYFGCFGRLFMVRNSVCVRMTLLENSGSMYGLMSLRFAPAGRAVLFALAELLAVLALT